MNLNRALLSFRLAKEAILSVCENNLNYYSLTRAIIQTNGVWFSRASDKELEKIRLHMKRFLSSNDLQNKGRIIIKVSFKSPAKDPDKSSNFLKN